jgi:hypothetical protein
MSIAGAYMTGADIEAAVSADSTQTAMIITGVAYL